MTAAEQVDHDPRPAPHPLAPGADLAVIREHLLPEDRPQFDLELRDAGADPDRRWDLVEHWRCVAVIQSDRARFAGIVRDAAEYLTGQPVPDDEPLEVTRRKAGM